MQVGGRLAPSRLLGLARVVGGQRRGWFELSETAPGLVRVVGVAARRGAGLVRVFGECGG